MRLRTRLIGCYASVAGIAVTVGVVHALTMSAAARDLEHVAHAHTPALVVLGRIEQASALVPAAPLGVVRDDAAAGHAPGGRRGGIDQVGTGLEALARAYADLADGHGGGRFADAIVRDTSALLAAMEAAAGADAVGSGEASGDVGAVVGRARAVVVDDVRRARRFEMSAIGRRVARASYRSFLGMLIGIGGAAAAVGLAVMLGVVRWRAFARPIGALRRSVDELGRGSWDARIVNTHRGDELGSLVDAFNDMAAQLADAHAELRELSRTDPLTKLLNRRAWEEAVGQAHEQFERYGRPYSVVLVDVDYFKAYNDAAGHQAGDACLVRIAGAMASVGRGLDVVGRYGGEEFVVLARETSLAAALSLAERVRCVIWELNIPHPGRAVLGRVTASVGVAMGKPGTWEHTLKEADDALYIAKRSGRNVVYGNKTPPHGDTNAASNTSPSGTTATPPAARIAPSHTVHSAPRNQPVP